MTRVGKTIGIVCDPVIEHPFGDREMEPIAPFATLDQRTVAAQLPALTAVAISEQRMGIGRRNVPAVDDAIKLSSRHGLGMRNPAAPEPLAAPPPLRGAATKALPSSLLAQTAINVSGDWI